MKGSLGERGKAMHRFSELIDHCTYFALQYLDQTNEKIIEALQTSGATSLVRASQMIQLQKAIISIGMHSDAAF